MLQQIRGGFLSFVNLAVKRQMPFMSLQVLRIFSAPRQFMETFQELCKVEESEKVGGL